MSADDELGWMDETLETPDEGDHRSLEGQDVAGDGAVETAEQISEAAERLSGIAELRPEGWSQIDAAQRLEVLQTVEQQMAEIQGRPALTVTASELPPGTFGQCDGQQIQINADNLAGDSVDVRQFVDTVAHEGRHAYQYYAINHAGFDTNDDQVAAWAENLQPGNYLNPEEFGQELYMNQPVEADAWEYGAQVAAALYDAPGRA
jgi:hypothetical protein